VIGAPRVHAGPPPERATLDRVPVGRTATVRALAIDGPERRRLMDLGVLPGARITPELRSPLRDPTAYRVRGSLIALRRRQACAIEVTLDADEAPVPGEEPRCLETP